MTDPAVRPDPTQGADPQGVPNLPRVLSPDEFEQARMLGPDQLAKAKFPVLPPPFVPRDATNTGNRPQGGVDPTRGKDSAAPKPGDIEPGLSGILTRQIINPVKMHPALAAAVGLAQFVPGLNVAVNLVMTGMMGKDVLEYSAQKAAEQSLPDDERKMAEADPGRISGEQAGTEAVLMGMGSVFHAVKKLNEVDPMEAARTSSVPLPDEKGFSRGMERSPEGSAAASVEKTGRDALRAQADKAREDLRTQARTDLAQNRAVGKMKLTQHVAAVTDAWNKIFAPANRGDLAKAAGNILRATTGGAAQEYEQAAYKLDEFRRAINPLPEADKLGFIDNIEGGKTQVTPEFQKAADAIRTTLDDARTQVQNLGTGKLDHFIEDYFPHIWENPQKAKLMFGEAPAPTPAPVQGPEIPRPRTASGRLKSLGGATPEELANEYAMAKQSTATPGFSDLLSGRLEAELTKRGIKPEDALAQGQQALAARKAVPTTNATLPSAASGGASDARTALEQAKAAAGGKRPMEGSKAFLKQRTIPTTAEGIALGLKPVSTNPVDLTLLKLREMQRYIMAHESLNQMKDADLVKYVASGEQAPDGYQRIDDKIATVFGPREGAVKLPEGATVGGGIDETTGLPKNADGTVNLYHHTSAKAADAIKATGQLKAAAEPDVYFTTRAETDTGYGDTAVPVRVDPSKLSIDDEFPNGRKDFRMSVGKPGGSTSVAVGHGEPRPMTPEDVGVPGTRIMGNYYAPKEVATVVNNYLSPGLRGNAIYDAYRGLGNTLNQAQLGLSAFHLMFTSMDASVSRAALGLEYLHSGLQSGDMASVAEGFRHMLTAPIAPVTNMRFGAAIREAYLRPATATPEMQGLANAVKEAGGRIRMDSFYKNSAPERMIAAWKQGEYGKATALSLPALFETAAKPIMEYIVPMQKLGVFGDMAKKVLADLPPEATLAERRSALSSAWDSVDNRMGQLVYDNLFWNKTFKDLSMGAVRSVGWNIGTIRELGGGLLDIGKGAKDVATPGVHAELTHKAAYVMALPLVVGMYGALYQYLRTGKGPEELKDYFFPKTGEQDADGNAERVQLASYMKDMFAYAGNPIKTLGHKESPLLSGMTEMLTNKDFYGDQIRNPDDPAVKQIGQEAEYIAKSFTPFSLTNMQEMSKRSNVGTATKLGNWFGILPAPRSKVRTDAQNEMADIASRKGHNELTPEQRDASVAKRNLVDALRGNKNIDLQGAVTDAIEAHGINAKEIGNLLKRAGTTPAQERFKTLTLTQAVEVFKKSTPKEQQMFGELLLKKVENATTRGGP